MKKKLLQIGSTIILIAMIFTTLANAAFWNTYTISRNIGEGTTYNYVSAQNSNGLQKVNYIEYKPNNNVKPMIAYGAGLYGRSTITRISSYLEGLGLNVIGGINADFFDLKSGIPIGIVINDSVLMTSSMSQYAVGFKEDGSAVIGKPTLNMAIQGPDGKYYTIDYYNKTRNNIGLFLLDQNFTSETKISSMGTNIILERTDDTPITVGGQLNLTVVGTERTDKSTRISENQMVLTISDSGPVARFPSYNVGDTVTISVTPSSEDWNDVTYAVGGKSLIQKGTISTSSIDSATSKAPRSAVGIKQDGTVVLYEIDGRQSSYSIGLTAEQLTNEMAELGCIDVLCLDGGGSSAMIAQYPGNSDSEVINKPSDGTLRSCANYIMLINTAIPTNIATKLNIYPKNQYLLPGNSTNLVVKATDDSYYPVELPQDMHLYSDDGLSTINGSTFTANSNTGKAVVKALSSTANGEQPIFIISDIDQIKLLANNKEITGITARGNETIDINAVVKYRNETVVSKDTDLKWTLTGNIGTIDQNGVFKSVNSPATGSISASYNGVTATIPVSIGMGIPQSYETITNFEENQPFTALYGSILSQISDVTKIYSGTKSLEIKMKNSEEELQISPQNIGDKKVLTFGVNSTQKDLNIIALFQDEFGSELEVNVSGKYENPLSYTSMSYNIPNEAAYFTGLKLSSLSGAYVYIDNIILNQVSVKNQLPIKITTVNAPETVLEGKSATIKVTVKSYYNTTYISPNYISAKIDGKIVTGSYNISTGMYTLNTSPLSNGIHRITIEAQDISGIITKKSFNIKSGHSTSKFTDTTNSWASDYINFTSDKGIIIGETIDGKNYFKPKRNLTRSEFAVIMARYLGLDTSSNIKLPYSDFSQIQSWALPSIKALYKAGIMKGSTSAGKIYFKPTSNISRAEVMTVISKALPRGYISENKTFIDSNLIPSWANSHVDYLVSQRLVNGYSDGSIKPLNSITREEISKMIYCLY